MEDMFQKNKLLIAIITSITILGLGQFYQGNIYAQEAVAFSEMRVENNFPDGMTFRVNVSSNVGEIVSAKFVSTTDNYYSSSSYSRETVEMEPGTDITLEYVMETGDVTVIPMMPINYYWDVVDARGNHYQSETSTVRYEDTRFDWKVKQNDQVGVWWHDRPDSFGSTVYDIANKAIQQQFNLFRTELDYQIIILIFNKREEFDSLQSVEHDWIGGQTFSNYGITTQIVEDSSSQYWLNAVIPHEISHLYFAQVTHNPAVSIPVWLNEGVAQYNEFTTNSFALRQVESAAKRGDLISLSSLDTGFGAFNEERIRLAYDEALSAVTYLVRTYGEDGLSSLLKAYKEGNTTDDAFRLVFGVDSGEFEADWAAWAGFSGEYTTPTPWALPTFRPSPTASVPQSRPPTTATVTTIATEHVNHEEDTATPIPVEKKPSNSGRNIPCLSCIPAMGLVIGVLMQKRFRKKILTF